MMTDLHNLQTPRGYYASLVTETGISGSLEGKFNDVDDAIQFHYYMHRLEDPRMRNFVLDFGDEDAWCAADLEQEDLNVLLSKPRPKCFGTRWINIWAPEEQKEAIKVGSSLTLLSTEPPPSIQADSTQAITTHYGVSERLQGMMCTEPLLHSVPRTATIPRKRQSSHSNDYGGSSLYSELDDNDLENAYALNDFPDQDSTVQGSVPSKNLSFTQVINQIWHFSSVDHGPRYTCIGYNSLYAIPRLSMPNGRDLPDGKRLWSWLILCHDGTVISIQENPFPRAHISLTTDEAKQVLGVVRRNIRFIFSGVSRQHSAITEGNSLVTIRVRRSKDPGPDQASIKQEDGPSLLFYYIFDDWMSSYGLIAKREHKYGVALEQLRRSMLERPVIGLVNELHWLGRRLAVLKRLYQSYELIMRRVLQRQRLLHDEARFALPSSCSYGGSFADTRFFDTRKSEYTKIPNFFGNSTSNEHELGSVGVHLSQAAVVRFERLVDRIDLYCLSEIESCLAEKESMTFLNFNLIALKDSQAVEKLTRITILLAKATLLFLPVSLMTAYFSTELQGVKGTYTTVEYWASFGVIMFLSIVLLTVFGYASDTVEGKTIYQSMVRTFYRSSRERLTQQRRGG